LAFYETVFEQWPAEFPGYEMIVRRTDGEWYVSPIQTVFNSYMGVFDYVEDDAFNEWFDNANAFNVDNAFEDAFNDAFGGSSAENELIFEELDSALSEDLADPDFDNFEPLEEPVFEESTFEEPFEVEVFPGEIFWPDDSAPGTTQSFSGSIEGTFDILVLELSEGETLTAFVETPENGTLDSTLTLYLGADEVAYNDDAPAEYGLPSIFDSGLEYTVDAPGFYEVHVASFEASGGGDYTVTATRG